MDETAADVTARGGRGIAARLDQRDDAQVRALFERAQAATFAQRYGFTDVDGKTVAPFAMPDENRLSD